MTPDFALTLSFEGISLLRRTRGGWVSVGDVALDAADLRGALAALRTEADALSPQGSLVRLVIPNEQIKYLSLPDPGLDENALRDDIRAALDGATPYAVDDLRFDWELRDGTVHVAAVAIETLDEAEAFAKSHHFEPVSFSAMALPGTFAGDVFFGQAASWTGTKPERDAAALTIIKASDFIEDMPARPEAPDVDSILEETDAQDALAPGTAADAFAPVPDPGPAAQPTEPAPAFASIRASRTLPAAAQPTQPTSATLSPPAPSLVAPTADDADVKPRLRLGGARKSTRNSDVSAPVLQVDPVDPAAERKGFGFFSSRKKPDSKAAEPPAAEHGPPPPPAPSIKHDPTPARAAVARIAAMRAGRTTEPDSPAPEVDERQRMTVFGARTAPAVGGKPRFLGLMLTSALLIFLLAVAAWASVFLDEGISRFFERDTRSPSIAQLPEIDLEPLDGSITEAEDDTGTVQIAALDTGDEGRVTDDGLSDVLPPPAALTPEEAEARYAATGIWQLPPDAPQVPSLTTLDDLYVASIDGRVEQFDAVALPDAAALRNDQTYLSHPNPTAPGIRFSLDNRGLVVATPEGTVNPEGVRIFAGLPPVVPPSRPTAPEVAEVPDATAPTDVNPALAAFRPRPRPDGLIEGNERAQLGGFTRTELASRRPTARPETLKAAEEAAQPQATQYAVATSTQPMIRPRNFARIVEQAQAQIQQAAPTEEVTQVAAVAPRTVEPRIPSSANVAREATVRNAINLRQINLIGVYGKPSDRRALVRLANGRYEKVTVGDRLDGGRVAAIGNSELRYTKGGRNLVLEMPN